MHILYIYIYSPATSPDINTTATRATTTNNTNNTTTTNINTACL